MVRSVRVHLLPGLTSQRELAGETVVVIDILRASSTVTAALAAGAERVVPCLEVTEARALAADRPGSLLGGERHGKKIAGFDLGNSPSEYTVERVRGKTIVFSTTNGTRALMECLAAGDAWIGCFANFSALLSVLEQAVAVHLLCAGTDGHVTGEDVLFAGAVAERLEALGAAVANDSASIASKLWRATRETAQAGAASSDDWLAHQLLATHGGRNLRQLGLADDVTWCARVDRTEMVPRLDLASWSICAGGRTSG